MTIHRTALFVVMGVGVIAFGYLGYDVISSYREVQNYLAAVTPPTVDNLVTRDLSYPESPTLGNTRRAAELIVRGVVETIGVVEPDYLGFPYLPITLNVDKVYKGSFNDRQLTFRAFGGVLDGTTYWSRMAPRFSVGEEVIVFLSKGDPDWFVTYGVFGKGVISGKKIEMVTSDKIIREPIVQFENRLKNP